MIRSTVSVRISDVMLLNLLDMTDDTLVISSMNRVVTCPTVGCNTKKLNDCSYSLHKRGYTGGRKN